MWLLSGYRVSSSACKQSNASSLSRAGSIEKQQATGRVRIFRHHQENRWRSKIAIKKMQPALETNLHSTCAMSKRSNVRYRKLRKGKVRRYSLWCYLRSDETTKEHVDDGGGGDDSSAYLTSRLSIQKSARGNWLTPTYSFPYWRFILGS